MFFSSLIDNYSKNSFFWFVLVLLMWTELCIRPYNVGTTGWALVCPFYMLFLTSEIQLWKRPLTIIISRFRKDSLLDKLSTVEHHSYICEFFQSKVNSSLSNESATYSTHSYKIKLNEETITRHTVSPNVFAWKCDCTLTREGKTVLLEKKNNFIQLSL